MKKFANQHVVPLTGELNWKTVPAINSSSKELIKKGSEVTFDLSQVTTIDNAGAGLLVNLTSFARAQGKKVAFTKLPNHLLEFLAAVKVKEILPIW